jgi:hypothetical protein
LNLHVGLGCSKVIEKTAQSFSFAYISFWAEICYAIIVHFFLKYYAL